VGPIDGFTWVYTPVLGAASMPGWGCIPISVPGGSRRCCAGGGLALVERAFLVGLVGLSYGVALHFGMQGP
jgi:hypothetical protein